MSCCCLHRILKFNRFSVWDVESNLELDCEGARIPMGTNGPCFELTHLIVMGYKDGISPRFTFVSKGVLVIM